MCTDLSSSRRSAVHRQHSSGDADSKIFGLPSTAGLAGSGIQGNFVDALFMVEMCLKVWRFVQSREPGADSNTRQSCLACIPGSNCKFSLLADKQRVFMVARSSNLVKETGTISTYLSAVAQECAAIRQDHQLVHLLHTHQCHHVSSPSPSVLSKTKLSRVSRRLKTQTGCQPSKSYHSAIMQLF